MNWYIAWYPALHCWTILPHEGEVPYGVEVFGKYPTRQNAIRAYNEHIAPEGTSIA